MVGRLPGDGTVQLWDAMTWEQKATLTGYTEYVQSVVFSPDGMTLASGDGDGTVQLWDAMTREHKATLTGVRSVQPGWHDPCQRE